METRYGLAVYLLDHDHSNSGKKNRNLILRRTLLTAQTVL